MSTGKREVWVDYVKVIACILVTLGHFFQSMVKSGILPDNDLYQWFNTTIYYFHVPLFFICSGFLYQQYGRVHDLASWKDNVKKKAIMLGVPYFTFSFLTWILKILFSGAVNSEARRLIETFFFYPESPYWYLYSLFFLFLITPNVKSRKSALALASLAVAAKWLVIVNGGAFLKVYAVSITLGNEIWFVFGMVIAVAGAKRLKQNNSGIICGLLFLVLSVLVYRMDNGFVSFGLGLLGCSAVLMLVYSRWGKDGVRNKVLDVFSSYTMPIFLMHTMSAAVFRSILLKMGISNAIVHIVLGLTISFAGPIVATEVMKKMRIDFLVYPGKLARSGKK